VYKCDSEDLDQLKFAGRSSVRSWRKASIYQPKFRGRSNIGFEVNTAIQRLKVTAHTHGWHVQPLAAEDEENSEKTVDTRICRGAVESFEIQGRVSVTK
jgi:hypothetical protein